MLGAHGVERLENHEGECALPNFSFRIHIGYPNEYARFLVGKTIGLGSAVSFRRGISGASS
jgi:hypothetical protein